MQRKKQALSVSGPSTSLDAYNAPVCLHIPPTPASSYLPSPARPTVAVSYPKSPKSSAGALYTLFNPHTSHCEKMLRLSLARDEHAQTGRRPMLFDANYSPDGSSSSSCSQRSRSPSPEPRAAPAPVQHDLPHPLRLPHPAPLPYPPRRPLGPRNPAYAPPLADVQRRGPPLAPRRLRRAAATCPARRRPSAAAASRSHSA
ncbi:hypothetical protein FRC12_023541 [Ceratobasidium sp. 428]|nr:hypothetical protein FRC12_023541 [Ceratobasidium sp. 428]